MRAATRIAGIVLATTALCGIGGLASAASAATPVASHQVGHTMVPTNEFIVHNRTTQDTRLQPMSRDEDDSFEGRPGDGWVLSSDQYAGFGLVNHFLDPDPDFGVATYDALDAAGNVTGTVSFQMVYVKGFTPHPESRCHATGSVSCTANGSMLTVDPRV